MAIKHIKTNAETLQEGYLLHIQFEKELKALRKDYPNLKEHNFEELVIEFNANDATLEYKAGMIERMGNDLY